MQIVCQSYLLSTEVGEKQPNQHPDKEKQQRCDAGLEVFADIKRRMLSKKQPTCQNSDTSAAVMTPSIAGKWKRKAASSTGMTMSAKYGVSSLSVRTLSTKASVMFRAIDAQVRVASCFAVSARLSPRNQSHSATFAPIPNATAAIRSGPGFPQKDAK